MREQITVAAEVRTSRGKNEARRTRAAGNIPAVVYGAYQDPVSVAVNPKELSKIIRSSTGLNTIFTLAIKGGDLVAERRQVTGHGQRSRSGADANDPLAVRRRDEPGQELGDVVLEIGGDPL